jgi:serine/threonine protein phosphatase PrpC
VCCVLADGAGGHGGGDVASRTAATAVLDAFAARPACDPARVQELIELANRAVVAGQPQSDATRDMRSTLVVWLCDPAGATAAWGHSGDSRLYCFRDGRLLLRTRDHSLYQAMIDAGMAEEANLRGNPQRNVLIASLGSLEDFEADVTAQNFPLLPGDAFLICSDGFWDLVPEAEMEAVLQRSADPQAWIEELEQTIVREARPGQDNYSALAVWYRSRAAQYSSISKTAEP